MPSTNNLPNFVKRRNDLDAMPPEDIGVRYGHGQGLAREVGAACDRFFEERGLAYRKRKYSYGKSQSPGLPPRPDK